MNQEIRQINMDDWVLSGGGANGMSYDHKEDNSLMLKMNKKSLPKEHTIREFQRSQSLYEMGISCPKIRGIVTDGHRYGLVAEKVNGKKSFVRIISEEPEQLETLARTFAHEAQKLHQFRCDNGLFPSYRETYIEQLSKCRVLSDKEKQILMNALDAMDDSAFCLHGDLTPGNIIRAEGKDYWIDLGDVMYGDPDIDYCNMMFASNHIPPRLIPYFYHISIEQYRLFSEIYAQEYYGERWGTQELNEKLHNVLLLKMGLTIFKVPLTVFFYRPFINGQERRYRIRRSIMDAIVWKY